MSDASIQSSLQSVDAQVHEELHGIAAELPEAREKLTYVRSMTEKARHQGAGTWSRRRRTTPSPCARKAWSCPTRSAAWRYRMSSPSTVPAR